MSSVPAATELSSLAAITVCKLFGIAGSVVARSVAMFVDGGTLTLAGSPEREENPKIAQFIIFVFHAASPPGMKETAAPTFIKVQL
jgi:hypothetical protein